MTLLKRLLSKVWTSYEDRKEILPAERLQISNLTRHTILATSAEVADTATLRNKGLLGRRELKQGEAMWIVPGEAVHTFFMQFAIDLMYLDRNCKVRKVRSGVRPWRISACLLAHSVVELPSGTLEETKTQAGDEVSLSAIPA